MVSTHLAAVILRKRLTVLVGFSVYRSEAGMFLQPSGCGSEDGVESVINVLSPDAPYPKSLVPFSAVSVSCRNGYNVNR
ncbi:MAG: hypothetical protein LBG58_11960 [Planctomycetaceae bacterium]|nr:hypothetical protein [Planctomycetaceae bacterium]